MAVRKPDSEVGPLGVWAYDTARLLGITPAQIAERAGVTEPTIRKIEGGSNKTPSRRVVFEMARYFREVGLAQNVHVDDPPGDWAVKPVAPVSDAAAYLARIDSLVGIVGELIEQNRQLIAALAPPPDDPVVDRAVAALGQAEGIAARERARSTSRPRRSDREHRGAERPLTIREGVSA